MWPASKEWSVGLDKLAISGIIVGFWGWPSKPSTFGRGGSSYPDGGRERKIGSSSSRPVGSSLATSQASTAFRLGKSDHDCKDKDTLGFKCGAPNHWLRDCPNIKTAQPLHSIQGYLFYSTARVEVRIVITGMIDREIKETSVAFNRVLEGPPGVVELEQRWYSVRRYQGHFYVALSWVKAKGSNEVIIVMFTIC